MRDDPKPSLIVPQTASSARTLRRVADTLGVPVSIFGGVEREVRPLDGVASPEEVALLAMVHSYLERANPAERDRFVTAIQMMVKFSSPE